LTHIICPRSVQDQARIKFAREIIASHQILSESGLARSNRNAIITYDCVSENQEIRFTIPDGSSPGRLHQQRERSAHPHHHETSRLWDI
jgi:hypothetical protein